MVVKQKLWSIPYPTKRDIEAISDKKSELIERLTKIANRHKSVRFATSLAVEDMVITDVIARQNLDIEVFTLETGLLHKETLNLLDKVESHYPHFHIQRFEPQTQNVAQYILKYGKLGFYESIEARKACCFARKIEPLNRALQGAEAWITGQRREQSVTRTELALGERDIQRNMDKYNPIFDWSEIDVWAYIISENVPYNQLYHQGIPSIGCEPCTRPVKEGEDIRAGRWWWESQDSKECGLHK